MKEQIATYYADQDDLRDDRGVVQAYEALARECRELWNGTEISSLRLVVVQEAEPYETAKAMFQDIMQGKFRVSGVNCEHPLWTPFENVRFRTVHDYFGHYLGNAGFSWKGELKAYLAQARHHSELARRALFTEIIGQTAYYSVYREFPTQKAFLYPYEVIEANLL